MSKEKKKEGAKDMIWYRVQTGCKEEEMSSHQMSGSMEATLALLATQLPRLSYDGVTDDEIF